jgi:hypothetical protein
MKDAANNLNGRWSPLTLLSNAVVALRRAEFHQSPELFVKAGQLITYNYNNINKLCAFIM